MKEEAVVDQASEHCSNFLAFFNEDIMTVP
jgi:hypothetical protein